MFVRAYSQARSWCNAMSGDLGYCEPNIRERGLPNRPLFIFPQRFFGAAGCVDASPAFVKDIRNVEIAAVIKR